MSNEDFKNYIATAELKNGEIYIGETRYMLLSVQWLADVMMETENIMGVGGTYALFDAASRKTKVVENFKLLLKDLPFEHKVAATLKFAALNGLGVLEPIEMSKEPFRIRLKSHSALFGDAYGGSADSPRCYFSTSLAVYFEAIAQLEGINEPLKVTEEQCKAMGADHCVIVIEIDKGFE